MHRFFRPLGFYEDHFEERGYKLKRLVVQPNSKLSLQYHFKRCEHWVVVSGHGKSGAKNGDLELDKLSSVYSDGDVFILGHNHQLYAKPVDSIRIVDGEESLRRRWYVRGGSFLRYANYARYSMYPIIRTGWVTTELTKDGIKCWEN